MPSQLKQLAASLTGASLPLPEPGRRVIAKDAQPLGLDTQASLEHLPQLIPD